jgi:hypothetical protein
MKTKRTRGMRNIPTIQGLRHRSLPTTREQTVGELARLEHEKARLNRELKLWMDHQKRTQGQLQKVEERLTLLQQILEPPAADDSPKRAKKARRSPAEKGDSGEGEAQGWQEIRLEY